IDTWYDEGMKFAVIFDMDGVLIDSVALNWQAYNQVLGREGLHVSADQMHQYVGMALEDQVRLFQKNLGFTMDAATFDAETAVIKESLFKAITPKPGVLDLLIALQQEGVPRAVATSTDRDTMQRRLHAAGIYDYFDDFVTEENVTAHKPHPEVYLAAAARLGCQPIQCTVIEDAPAGLQAAKAAGMACVVVATPYVPKEYVDQADLLVPSLETVTVATLRGMIPKE
ncbi:MAG TPA: HAD family phosphatase, partial [Candidatus Saccharimonadales bacterium]|nr:HAD family phosphatase [Candidatus Saccharimonadales bacterium]